MSAAVFGERLEPGYSSSFALSFAIHAMLLAVLFLGVRWQSHPPQSVTVELWEPPQPEVVPPKPSPKIEPEPPKPEPRIEKPEIVEKPAPKPKPEVKPKPVPPKADDREFRRQMREQLVREQAAAQERDLKNLIAREQAASLAKRQAQWIEKIRAKIKGNIPVQALEGIVGNPEAIYDVVLLPTLEVLSAKIRKSSGYKVYDEAVERAILKSSPLPPPVSREDFSRELKLTFKPQDK